MAKDKQPRKTSAETHQLIMNLRLIDDIMFEKFAEDPDAVEEIIQVILEEPNLRVKPDSIVAQKVVANIGKRSIRLDAYIEGAEDIVFNIEIQRSNNCNHVKRVRYNASALTVNGSEPGDAFEHIQNITVIYISEFDMFKAGKPIYHAEMTVRETNTPVSDGLKCVYVNTAVNDGSKIARLMECFTKPDFVSSEFPKTAHRVHEIKHSESEVGTMCNAVEEYAKQYAEQYAEESRRELILEALINGSAPEDIARILHIDISYVLEIQNEK